MNKSEQIRFMEVLINMLHKETNPTTQEIFNSVGLSEDQENQVRGTLLETIKNIQK